jgi:phosphate-starvation-inducible protein E
MSARVRALLPARRPLDLQTGIVRAESLIYLVIGLLLVAAAALTLIGTIADVIEGSRSRPVTDVGVFLLERILLIFIIAELLYTLRLVDFGGTILVEAFLFIGFIAVVRRILLVTAEARVGAGRRT